MTSKELVIAIKEHISKIAAERDKLRELISDAEDIESSCNEAVEALERAVDKLSEYL